MKLTDTNCWYNAKALNPGNFKQIESGDVLWTDNMATVKNDSVVNGVVPGWDIYVLMDGKMNGEAIKLDDSAAVVIWNAILDALRG